MEENLSRKGFEHLNKQLVHRDVALLVDFHPEAPDDMIGLTQ